MPAPCFHLPKRAAQPPPARPPAQPSASQTRTRPRLHSPAAKKLSRRNTRLSLDRSMNSLLSPGSFRLGLVEPLAASLQRLALVDSGGLFELFSGLASFAPGFASCEHNMLETECAFTFFEARTFLFNIALTATQVQRYLRVASWCIVLGSRISGVNSHSSS